MNAKEAIEIVRKIREIRQSRHSDEEEAEGDFFLTEPEAAALLTDEPSKTAEEVATNLLLELDSFDKQFREGKIGIRDCTSKQIKAVQSALDAKAKECADRFCALCPERDIADDGTVICESDWNGKYCNKRAAILGKEGE